MSDHRRLPSALVRSCFIVRKTRPPPPLAAIDTLKATKRLSAYRRRDGLTDLVPQNRDDVEFGAMKSAKCDRGFYKRRAELIDRVLFNRELTPGQRLVMLGIAAMTDPDTRQCDAGQTYLATALNVNRNTVITAMPKLAAEGYVLRAASSALKASLVGTRKLVRPDSGD